MLEGIFAIHDSLAEAYNTPFFSKNAATALRQFADACKNPESGFHQHAADYTLYQIGVYESDNGRVAHMESNVLLGNAAQFTSLRPDLVEEPSPLMSIAGSSEAKTATQTGGRK